MISIQSVKMEAYKFLCIFFLGAFFSVAIKYYPVQFYLTGGALVGAKSSKYEQLTPYDIEVKQLEGFTKKHPCTTVAS